MPASYTTPHIHHTGHRLTHPWREARPCPQALRILAHPGLRASRLTRDGSRSYVPIQRRSRQRRTSQGLLPSDCVVPSRVGPAPLDDTPNLRDSSHYSLLLDQPFLASPRQALTYKVRDSPQRNTTKRFHPRTSVRLTQPPHKRPRVPRLAVLSERTGNKRLSALDRSLHLIIEPV